MDPRYEIEDEKLTEAEILAAFHGREVTGCDVDQYTGSIKLVFNDGTGLHVGSVCGDPAFFRMRVRGKDAQN